MKSLLNTDSTSLHFVPCTATDVAEIEALAKEIWPKVYDYMISQEQITYMLKLFYSQEALQKQMANGQVFYIAKQGENSLGFLSIEHNCSFEQQAASKLHKLYAKLETHGTGIGKAMFAFVCEQAKQHNSAQLFLNVNRHNKAIAFYTRQGMSIAYDEDIDIGEGYFMNDYVMNKSLLD
ncbi:MAG: hypothetical protein RL660_1497 [Bacteroidota bacterium]|jgi:GNAT superfamily N-acetyltransferase